MTMQARLQKVTENLSPLQRIVLLLRAQREGREPDPDLGHVTDPQQSKAFNRYVALNYVINRELGSFCHANNALTQSLEYCAEQVRLLERAAESLEEEHGLQSTKRPRDWRKSSRMEVPEFLRSIAAETRKSLADAVGLRWRELLALDQVWAELSEEFGGEEPVHPELRAMADETKQMLLALAAEMRCRRRLGEPDEALLANVRATVDDAFEKLGPLL